MPLPAAFRTLRRTTRRVVSDPPRSVRELPGRAVRGTVIGIGHAALFAGRVREEYRHARREGVGATLDRLRNEGIAGIGRGPAGAGGPSAAPPVAPSAPGKTRPAAPEGTPVPSAVPDDAPVPSAAPAAPAGTATGAPEPDDLPVPNYDELSVPSLRARLRGLSLAQVEQLLAYERTHANRPSVVTMYDNRIRKLRSEEKPAKRAVDG